MNAIAADGVAEAFLTDAFSAFIAAANRLEKSHRQLHAEVSQLRRQLAQRDSDLAISLREKERVQITLHQILEALPCGVAVFDPVKQEVFLANPEARRLLDIASNSELRWSIFPAPIRDLVASIRGSNWKEGDEQELCITVDGAKRWLAVRYSQLNGLLSGAETRATAELPAVILIVRDTTARREAEAEREKSRHMLALAEVATVIAHEIRNPLGSLELLVGLLAYDESMNSESRQCVEHLQAGVRSLSATVNNVLRFHSLGSASLAPVKLSAILRGAIDFVRPLTAQGGVAVESDGVVEVGEIAADPTALQQIILNLTCNALRHTPAGGTISISTKTMQQSSGKVAVVEFSDTGNGIEPEHLSRIFEPGFSTTGQTPGLGLTVCRRIVEQHAGSIFVSSRSGQGTTFSLEFPAL